MEYRGFTLDRFQEEAIHALEAGHSVLVSAPTGTGKTVVADWVVERALEEGKQVVYTAPIKALSNQKFRDYAKLFGHEKVGLVTGDLVIHPDAPCRVMTTEILRNMLLVGQNIPDLAAVVIDEIHFLDDPERGTTWEELLIYLPAGVQVVGLSATLSNLHEFAEWLCQVRGHPVEIIEEHKRAVPLEFLIATREGRLQSPVDMDRVQKQWAHKNAYALRRAAQESRGRGDRRRGPKVAGPTRHQDVYRMLWPNLAPYLYFVFSRRDAEGMARNLARNIPQGLLTHGEFKEVDARISAFRSEAGGDEVLDRELANMLQQGVAFHHAGLHVQLKTLVESLYEAKLIKVLYCTGTFALGINMPARTAVFDGLKRFNGEEMIRLPTREFMQMAGRAGRRGMDEAGTVIVRTDMEQWPEISSWMSQYLNGRYEPVRSRFSLSFNSVINLLERHSAERIRALVEKSFLAFFRARRAEKDQAQMAELERQLKKAGWTPGQKPSGPLKRDVKQLRRMRDRSATAGERTWQEFQEKVMFLERWGYIGEEGVFNAGAKALQHVQISEVFVTELVLEGVLEGLDADTLFGVLCGIVAELPRATRTNAGKGDRGLARHIERIQRSPIVAEAEELTGLRTAFDPTLIAFGRWWAEGRSLNELMLNLQSPTDISGSLVGAFRRAKDLVGQLRGVWRDDEDRVAELERLSRRVTRDEVKVVG